MFRSFRVVMAQMDFLVGDIAGNADKIIASAFKARDQLHANLIIFPELSLTGYPPEDLLLRPAFISMTQSYLAYLCREIRGISAVIGCPIPTINGLYNAAIIIMGDGTWHTYYKQCLPNYGVFDEKRYFIPGNQPVYVKISGIRLGITICEDIWQPDPVKQLSAEGVQLIININASPYHIGKDQQRLKILRQRVNEGHAPIIYVNLCGGQDELVFDGGSLVMHTDSSLKQKAPAFSKGLYPVDFTVSSNGLLIPIEQTINEEYQIENVIYQALVLGVRDYVEKNHFPGVIIGLSGGIDSALTLAIAVDALGAHRVEVLSLPSRYTARISNSDAELEAKVLGVKHHQLCIEPAFQSFLNILHPIIVNSVQNSIVEENIQARCRNILLMAISNQTGKLLLATCNKSEMAVGYSTIYGDMSGGFAPIKDIFKTMVYKLANYRNSISPVIPQRVLDRPPSAELRSNQIDLDSLPPYEILDQLLLKHIEHNLSRSELISLGFESTIVDKILRLVKISEYKRKQAPPGIKISTRAFGRDWRYPVTSV